MGDRKRKPYKQYINYSAVKLPRSTYYDKNPKATKLRFSTPIIQLSSSQSNELQQTTSLIQPNCTEAADTQPTEAVLNEYLLDDIQLEENYNQVETTNSQNPSSPESVNESSIEELNNIFQNETISREDLASGYLAAFYNGRDTQKSLSKYLALSNIASPIKLPTDYNGLISLLIHNKKNLNYKKSWYCGVCHKIFTKIDHRLQRDCGICKTTK